MRKVLTLEAGLRHHVRPLPVGAASFTSYQEDLLNSRVSQGYGCLLRPSYCMYSLPTKVLYC